MAELVPGSVEFNIKQTIAGLLFRHPFYGFLIQTMKWRQDNSRPTMSTNGKEIIYNSDFFNELSTKERVFLIGHELGHCILGHCYASRRSNKDKEYWAMAIDYKVNWLLKKDGVGEMPTGKYKGLYDPKYDMTWSSEDIYDDLVKNNPQKQPSLDEHIDGDQSKETKAELEKAAGEFQQKVIEAHQFSKMAGTASEAIETLVNKLLNPKINWRKLLQTTVQSLFRSDITWQRPNRRTIDPRFILPSIKFDETVDICVSIDTSGSISEQMKVMVLSEIAGILKYYKNFKLSVWCFDTEVHNLKTYNQASISEISSYVLAGGGGTYIACNFDFMKRQKIKPRSFVCFTDGFNFNDKWGDPSYCPTTWLIHSNSNPKIPFGKFAIVDKE